MHDARYASVSRSFTDVGTRVTVSGELDAGLSAEFRRVLAAALVAGGTIEVDLGDVTFVDSFGLSALVDARDQAAAYGVGLRVCRTNPAVQRLLRVTDLADDADDADVAVDVRLPNTA